ncbi:hypothetical protein [Phycisphaera mikurensis]|uniref:Uncharacterized protein n=1 Tax=Phycisphaera mikurensis (strain NBRC 102666 / KCTC 22515 / FYK2301M01) TaxID=1142394 RepID=I0IEX7_PHYMF|nr:hypothetical protein [Phycisphaera mikurensis]MBB6441609.1 hypothetical protein [Phycisphaera mikurensis]BAM03815.1 hypothetical protein PSMK_16560 [Phycisphaera mikurensis NBRC 102666]
MNHRALIILPDASCVAAAEHAGIRCMGDLAVLGGLTDAEVDIAGSLACEGRIVGGRVACGGRLTCLSLGAEDSPTAVWVNAPPPDDRDVVEAGWRQHATLGRELADLGPRDDARRQELQARREGILWRLDRLAESFGGGVLEVLETLEPGVSLRLGVRPERYTFVQRIAGPLRIEAAPDGHPLLRQGDRVTPLRGAGGWVRA